MKTAFENEDLQAIAKAVSQAVVKSLKPLLIKGGTDDLILDVDGLAHYLKTSKRWVYEQTHLKAIPFIKIGRFPRFRKRDIDKWLETQGLPAINPISRPLQIVK